MKHFFFLTLVILLSSCVKDQPTDPILKAPDTTLVETGVSIDTTTKDTTGTTRVAPDEDLPTKEIPADVLELVKAINDDIGNDFVVGENFYIFFKGDKFKITTREGKKGYPFYEPINGVYHYWVEFNGDIIPVKGSDINQYCAQVK